MRDYPPIGSLSNRLPEPICAITSSSAVCCVSESDNCVETWATSACIRLVCAAVSCVCSLLTALEAAVSWDVVNEAVEPKDGRADGLRNSPWLGLIGPEYIELAFKTAAEADPSAKLTYNDYGIELDSDDQALKRGQVLMLVRRLKARNIPIHAVGLQSHLQATGPQPGAGLRRFIREMKELGLEVYVTEMDVNTRGVDGGPDAQDQAVALVYGSYLCLVLEEPNAPVALTWGITDAHTWLNAIHGDWAKRADGAEQRPLPFDAALQPTPAFVAARAAIDAARPLVQSAAPKSWDQVDPALMYQPFRVQGSPDSHKLSTAPASPAASYFAPTPQ